MIGRTVTAPIEPIRHLEHSYTRLDQCTVAVGGSVAESSPRHSVSVAAAIVADDGRVLAIQRRDNGKWEPPGGVLEVEESIEDGLRREVREEAGLEIEIETLTGVYKNMKRGIIGLVFRCRQAGGELTTSDEAVSVRWITPEEVRRDMDQAYAVRLLDAMEAGPPRIRHHDGFVVSQGPREVN